MLVIKLFYVNEHIKEYRGESEMSRTKRSTFGNQAPHPSLFSIGLVAERLGVSAFTVRRLIQKGALKSVRIARRVMIPEVEIERAIENGCEG